MNNQDLTGVLDDVLNHYRQSPIDLLEIGDADGEDRYLSDARKSYLRTLEDVRGLVPSLPGAGALSRQVRILELGSYLGPVSVSLARLGFEVTAADLPVYLANPRLRALYSAEGVQTMACDLKDYHLPAEQGSFELVIMCETLEHLNFNPLPVLREIHRVLVDGGCLYISLPNLATLVNRIKLFLGGSIHNPVDDFAAQLSDDDNMIVGIHWREYTGKELLQLLNLSGFHVERHYYFTNTASHPLARLAYRLCPALRPNQTAVGRKG